MNTITRELIERELKDVTFKRDMAVEEVKSAQRGLRNAEERRDELNDKIAALKDGLTTLEARTELRMKIDAAHLSADDLTAALDKYTERVNKLYG